MTLTGQKMLLKYSKIIFQSPEMILECPEMILKCPEMTLKDPEITLKGNWKRQKTEEDIFLPSPYFLLSCVYIFLIKLKIN